MGGCFSFGFSCDETLERLFRWLTCEGYVRNIEENLTDLKRQMEDLKATEDEVKNRVEREEGLLHQQRRPAVKVWLTLHVWRTSIDGSLSWIVQVPLSLKTCVYATYAQKNYVRATNMGKVYSCCLKRLRISN